MDVLALIIFARDQVRLGRPSAELRVGKISVCKSTLKKLGSRCVLCVEILAFFSPERVNSVG